MFSKQFRSVSSRYGYTRVSESALNRIHFNFIVPCLFKPNPSTKSYYTPASKNRFRHYTLSQQLSVFPNIQLLHGKYKCHISNHDQCQPFKINQRQRSHSEWFCQRRIGNQRCNKSTNEAQNCNGSGCMALNERYFFSSDHMNYQGLRPDSFNKPTGLKNRNKQILHGQSEPVPPLSAGAPSLSGNAGGIHRPLS